MGSRIYIYVYIYIHIYIYIYIYITPRIPSFFFCQALLEKMIKLNPKVYDLMNFLKNNFKARCLISGEEYHI